MQYLLDELHAALDKKYLKDYQFLYYVRTTHDGSLYGIKIDTSLCTTYPVDKEWIGDIEEFDMNECQVISEEEFKKELETLNISIIDYINNLE